MTDTGHADTGRGNTGRAEAGRAEARVRAAEAVAALRSLAARRPDDVALLDGFPDAELDAWPVPVPEAVRTVLREAGGIAVDGEPYLFGPVRADGDGLWELGALSCGEGAVHVGVEGAGGAGRDDWGPVVSLLQRLDEHELIVEAPTFTDWLLSVAELLDGGAEGLDDRPAPAVSVPALPTVAVAEGGDGELAALVGCGDPLTDLVDLHAPPGHPCAVRWEPYHSLRHSTADTGSSRTVLRLAGGGRALLVRSDVGGDFLGRPVTRHRVPEDAPARAVAELRALAARFPDRVALEPGCADSAMDTWPVPVPEDVRAVLREVGAVTVEGMPPLRLLPGAPGHAVDPEAHRMMGGDGSYWPVAFARHARRGALVQVRVAGDGTWGYVVSVPAEPDVLRRSPEVTVLAESLPHLLLTVARYAREAAATGDFARAVRNATRSFSPNTGEPWVRPVPAGEFAGSGDPLAASLADLPAGSYAADLRGAPFPGDVCFHRIGGWGHRPLDRLLFPGAGRLVAAVPAT
ncbi:hypothetical protein [Streptomyces sudanensis]|uniref:hypothetical protein n=1 Tax=Streptomyces sudanensis TaxID=436397 RepID=UPI0020CDA7BF|nr:hypothetical protein [Streptomyces sudanensis]MCP9956708.1 hypothetical protein [Streptomyces sudanensis]